MAARRKNFLACVAGLVNSWTNLITAFQCLVLAASALLITVQTFSPVQEVKSVPPHLDQCAPVEKLLQLDYYQAADILFFERHPERHGLLIRSGESHSLKDEWWLLHDFVVFCREK